VKSEARNRKAEILNWDFRFQTSHALRGEGVLETKQQILKAIEDLPDDATVEDALERLYLLYKVDKGIKQADSGELLSQEGARQRMARWLK